VGVRQNNILITVADQGIGISPEDLSILFERYFRIRSSANLHIPGSGLGLAISRAIIEAHGGRIWVESKQGEGTTIYFTFAKDPKPRYVQVSSKTAANPWFKERSCVRNPYFDRRDEPRVVNLLREILGATGYKVLAAFSGENAIETAALEQPDLILWISSYRRMDGFQLAHRLRNSRCADH
jgi:hypothetical protein